MPGAYSPPPCVATAQHVCSSTSYVFSHNYSAVAGGVLCIFALVSWGAAKAQRRAEEVTE